MAPGAVVVQAMHADTAALRGARVQRDTSANSYCAPKTMASEGEKVSRGIVAGRVTSCQRVAIKDRGSSGTAEAGRVQGAVC